MEDRERITNPTMGSNDVGTETNESTGRSTTPGTDTQTRLAALSTEKKKKEGINDDELVVKNEDGKSEFPDDSPEA